MNQFKSIVILTGAGISAESGIKTFRAADGLWENHRIEEVASPEGFAANPELVQDFYNQRRRQLLTAEVKENLAHQALARLEQKFNGDFLLVTQNIDDLHERSGSQNMIHIHGELLKKRCTHSDQVSDIRGDIQVNDVCDCCGRKGTLRPHIVWFGEMPFEMERIQDALSRCDLFVSIGTSGNVYPAAGFVALANQAGAKTRMLNLDPSTNETAFDQGDYGLATKIVPEFVESLIGQ
ncbi:NAD-dependent protein deacylase [Mariniblastus sp.]|nr:NAD-dependent protein deacylase [Mariniblastus sp.]